MIRINFDADGYVANFADKGDVENSSVYEGSMPEGFAQNCRCCRLAGGELVFDAQKQEAMIAAEASRQELAALKSWFAWYDNQVMQYLRMQRRGTAFDRNMMALDAQAAEKQQRLRALLGGKEANDERY